MTQIMNLRHLSWLSHPINNQLRGPRSVFVDLLYLLNLLHFYHV